MRMPKLRDSNLLEPFAFTVGAVMVLSGCNVNVERNSEGHDKKVDIETPIGGLHVNKEADVRDAGLAGLSRCGQEGERQGRRQRQKQRQCQYLQQPFRAESGGCRIFVE